MEARYSLFCCFLSSFQSSRFFMAWAKKAVGHPLAVHFRSSALGVGLGINQFDGFRAWYDEV